MKVVLLRNNRETKCFGSVHVSVNGVNKPVCGTKWTRENSETVCKELNCGKVKSLNKSHILPVKVSKYLYNLVLKSVLLLLQQGNVVKLRMAQILAV